MKKTIGIYDAPAMHWVGDGFPVRTLFHYGNHGRHLSPFLLLDYAGPASFAPGTRPRGVGEHPHRGFETVTIVYQGEVDHRDSTGAGGHIGPGDVQWMTAASGILHEEFHSEAFTRRGGVLEMVQLWVNLPARDKMAEPRYQGLLEADIPAVPLPGGAGRVRVIAGEFAGHRGPARTFTAMNVWDMHLSGTASAALAMPEGHTLGLVVLHGAVQLNGREFVREAQMALFDRSGTDVAIETDAEATLLVLGGQPINEPVAGHGPFVMNTDAEIRQAIDDFRSGRFGRMPT
ncbi:MAG: pirin family protein [Gammaproteobacteria bacterium]|nr:pirin family protein [Gammaproteobacteria bacterium]